MPLYGHEMDDGVTPLETGLGHYVKLDRAGFIGREALLAAGEPKRARIGLKMIGRGIAREHFPVFAGNRQVGHTTSGTHCPTVGPVAMALVEADCQTPGDTLFVEIQGSLIAAAKREELDFAVDVYPHYGSDADVALTAGYDVRHGLIGAGVYASHGYERSHVDGVKNTFKLLCAYLG